MSQRAVLRCDVSDKLRDDKIIQRCRLTKAISCFKSLSIPVVVDLSTFGLFDWILYLSFPVYE